MMIYLIVWLAICFTWLLYETDLMRVRLLVGEVTTKYARYEVVSQLRSRLTDIPFRTGSNMPDGYKWNGEACYTISLHPGLDNILCGWEWLDEHVADLVDYQPEVSMTIAGVRYNMTIKQPSVIKDIMRVNKLTKREKLALV